MGRPLLEKESLKDMAETEGARRASGVSATGAGGVPDPEVAEKPKRPSRRRAPRALVNEGDDAISLGV